MVNKELISEIKESDMKLKKYKENLDILTEKEKIISELPYSDEYPRYK